VRCGRPNIAALSQPLPCQRSDAAIKRSPHERIEPTELSKLAPPTSMASDWNQILAAANPAPSPSRRRPHPSSGRGRATPRQPRPALIRSPPNSRRVARPPIQPSPPKSHPARLRRFQPASEVSPAPNPPPHAPCLSNRRSNQDSFAFRCFKQKRTDFPLPLPRFQAAPCGPSARSPLLPRRPTSGTPTQRYANHTAADRRLLVAQPQCGVCCWLSLLY
jgi:hypothetical protein